MREKSGQSFLEYVAMIMVIIAVCAVAGIYYMRSVQGEYRQTGDSLGGGELH